MVYHQGALFALDFRGQRRLADLGVAQLRLHRPVVRQQRPVGLPRPQKAAVAGEGAGHAEQVDHARHQVHPQVHQRPVAQGRVEGIGQLARLVGVELGGILAVGQARLAQHPQLGQAISDGGHIGRVYAAQPLHQHHAVGLGRLEHLFRVGAAHRHGLFHQHVLARLQQGDGLPGVQGDGRGDVHPVHLPGRAQRLQGIEPQRRAVGLGEGPGVLQAAGVGRRHRHAGDLLRRPDPLFRDPAPADDRHSDHLHSILSFFRGVYGQPPFFWLAAHFRPL